MWNSSRPRYNDEDNSWLIQAFAQDTGNVMGTTWPPRSYTCMFCLREFRSAQALGGHMNIHRRDRARLRQSPPISDGDTPSSPPTSNLIFPAQEFLSVNSGLSHFPHHPLSATGPTKSINRCMELSPSTSLPLSSNYTVNSLISSSKTTEKEVIEPLASIYVQDNDKKIKTINHNNMGVVEDLDLELRLGSSRSSSKKI